ncbi:MAG: hypothetical protein U0183_10175 [Polyangiaceae bacterium]
MSRDTVKDNAPWDPLETMVAFALVGLAVYACVDTVARRARELRAHFGARGTSAPPRMP